MGKSPYRDRASLEKRTGKRPKSRHLTLPSDVPPPVPPRRVNRGTSASTPRPSAKIGRGRAKKIGKSVISINDRPSKYVAVNTKTTAHDFKTEGSSILKRKKTQIILLAVLATLVVLGVLGYLVWWIFFSPNECTNEELPLEYRAIVCERIQAGKSCSFDPKTCEADCPVGFETDEYACAVSCTCATAGVFESDVTFDENNLQSLLSVYMTSEDHTLQLFSGSATNVLNIWNTKKVGSSVRVPYVISQDLDPAIASTLNATILVLGNVTCVELVLRTNESDYINFRNGVGCSSLVSRIGGEQNIVLSKNCNSLGVIMHEIMHTLGFWHEHSRPDRAEYIKVMWDNIDKASQHHFNKRSIDTVFDFGSPYDVGSVMHFSGYSFSKNFVDPTMINLNTSAAVKVQRDYPSDEDVAEINALYECYIPLADSVKSASWGQWSQPGQCTMTCGKGVQYKVRECLDEQSEIVPHRFCGADYHIERECDGGVCEQGMWGAWSPCDHTCGLGTRKRTSCCGQNTTTETDNCNDGVCTDPANAFWGEWQEWGACLRTCGNGMRRRYRNCFDMFDTKVEYLRCPQVGTAHLEVEVCAPDPCSFDSEPIIGAWGEWKGWSGCSRTCGVGSKNRERDCLAEDGSVVKYCLGEATQVRPCNMTACPPSVVSLWTPWEPWSDCSSSCGGGSRSRRRTCHSSVALTIETDCGESSELVDDEERTETCRNEPCDPPTAMWAEWESWGECSKDCRGQQWRLRICVGGSLGDPECPWNALYDRRGCNEDPCDLTGKSLADDPSYTGPRWAPWYQWGECSVTCDGGWTKRYRLCETVDQVMSYDCVVGNNKTSGHRTDRKKCSTKFCHDPKSSWTIWEPWSSCTATCGKGIKTRKRKCLEANGCEGHRLDSEVCVLPSCLKMNARLNKKQRQGIFTSKKLSGFFSGKKVSGSKKSSKPIFLGKSWSRTGAFCDKRSRLYLADFNGDTKNDMLCLSLKGRIKIAYAATVGAHINDWEKETGFCSASIGLVYAVDFNGDGAADLMCYNKDSGKYTVMFSYGGRFDGKGGEIKGEVPKDFCRKLTQTVFVDDIDKDGKGDLVCRDGDEEEVLFNE